MIKALNTHIIVQNFPHAALRFPYLTNDSLKELDPVVENVEASCHVRFLIVQLKTACLWTPDSRLRIFIQMLLNTQSGKIALAFNMSSHSA